MQPIRTFRHQRGNITILMVVSMIGLLEMATFAIDGGYIFTTRAQLQHSADSGALAGIDAIRDGLTTNQALDFYERALLSNDTNERTARA